LGVEKAVPVEELERELVVVGVENGLLVAIPDPVTETVVNGLRVADMDPVVEVVLIGVVAELGDTVDD